MTLTSAEVALFSQVMVAIISIVEFIFFTFQRSRKTCGWEVLWVSGTEFLVYTTSAGLGKLALAPQTSGHMVPWLRYAGWLLTCPIILVNLINIQGLDSKRADMTTTLVVLTLNQFIIVSGISADIYAFNGYFKGIAFAAGMFAGIGLYYCTIRAMKRHYDDYPEHKRYLVTTVSAIFHGSWLLFPLLFVLGPNMLALITAEHSIISHSIADLISKNLWGVVTWRTRWAHVKLSLGKSNSDKGYNNKFPEQKRLEIPQQCMQSNQGPNKATFEMQHKYDSQPHVDLQERKQPDDVPIHVMLIEKNIVYQKLFMGIFSNMRAVKCSFAFSIEQAHLILQRGEAVDVLLVDTSKETIPVGSETTAAKCFAEWGLFVLGYCMDTSQDIRMEAIGIQAGIRNPLDTDFVRSTVLKFGQQARERNLLANELSVSTMNEHSYNSYNSSTCYSPNRIQIPRSNSFTALDIFGPNPHATGGSNAA